MEAEAPCARRALTQTLLLGAAFFCIPGGYNALMSMAGGIGDENTMSKGNTITNIIFAAASLFAPAAVNIVGARWAIFLGSLGYPIYVTGLLFAGLTKSIGEYWILVASGVVGLGAALLWTAQGALLMAYPTQEKKGSYFAYFWIMFNLGGVCTSFSVFLTNLNSHGTTASETTFWIFIALMLVGCCLLLCLQNPNKVIRPDGNPVVIVPNPGVLGEILEMLKLVCDPRAMALVPLFLYTNWCYSYQFLVYNSPLFTTPTAALNNVFYCAAQMFAAWVLGNYTDSDRPFNVRAYVSLNAVGTFSVLSWTGGAIANYYYDLAACPTISSAVVCQPQIDFKEWRYILPMLLYLCWGATDAFVQCWCYWILGQMDDRPEVLSRYAGWYKTFNSLGSALGAAMVTAFNADVQLWINIVLFTVGLIFAEYVCFKINHDKGEMVSTLRLHEYPPSQPQTPKN